jgi:preprotein translocase subunit SecF
MKKDFKFSKYFFPSAILSCVILVFCITGFFTKGFTLGVDFQAGLLQEVKLAPSAFNIRWYGTSNAIFSFDRNNLYIVISGVDIENRTYTFPLNEYNTIGSLTRAMTSQLNDLEITLSAQPDTSTQWLLYSTQGNPYLSSETPFVVHYLPPFYPEVSIADVRTAMVSIGQSVSVQSVGSPQDRHFMIRLEDTNTDGDNSSGRIRADQITQVLEATFGKGEVAVIRSDYVGSRFSKDLTDQAGILTFLTLLLILIYASIRFKPQYAMGAVIGIMHDAVVVLTFVIWARIEFSTSVIAALLAILGYSINNTIVVFDRIRENRRIYAESSFLDVLNRSLNGVLSRTIITTVTTMLAIIFLFIFATGAMKNFALALIIGMTSGVYTTLLIAPGFVHFWENQKIKNDKRSKKSKTVNK